MSNLKWILIDDCTLPDSKTSDHLNECAKNSEVKINDIRQLLNEREKMVSGIPEVLPFRIRFEYEIQGGDIYTELNGLAKGEGGDLINNRIESPSKLN